MIFNFISVLFCESVFFRISSHLNERYTVIWKFSVESTLSWAFSGNWLLRLCGKTWNQEMWVFFMHLWMVWVVWASRSSQAKVFAVRQPVLLQGAQYMFSALCKPTGIKQRRMTPHVAHGSGKRYTVMKAAPCPQRIGDYSKPAQVLTVREGLVQ